MKYVLEINALSMSVICHPHLWMSSMDLIHWLHFHPWMMFLHPWDINAFHVHPWMRFLHSWDIKPMDATFIHGWDLFIHPWNCLQVSSMDFIHEWKNLIHGWKCHRWMSSMDDFHGWGWQMTDMDRADIIQSPSRKSMKWLYLLSLMFPSGNLWYVFCIEFSLCIHDTCNLDIIPFPVIHSGNLCSIYSLIQFYL